MIGLPCNESDIERVANGLDYHGHSAASSNSSLARDRIGSVENVLDLFGGSGSTLIAAEQTNRRSFLMELDPLYADVIVDRWQRFSGKQAVSGATGEAFPKAPPATREQMR